MVDFDCKTKVVSSPDASLGSPKLPPGNGGSVQLPFLLPAAPFRCPPGPAAAAATSASAHAVAAYKQYLRLPELRKLWGAREFPEWRAEPLLRPALQALEITFRFVSTALSDPRPYTNRREWRRRLESLAAGQIRLIAAIVEDEEAEEGGGAAPLVGLSSAGGALARGGSSAEVWRIPGAAEAAVSRASEASLLPRLATWHTSEDVAQRILYAIECEMRGCPFTLGLGEPNLIAKPALLSSELHALKQSVSSSEHVESYHQNPVAPRAHQILESWICASSELLKRIEERIEEARFQQAASGCYLLERIWKLLAEIEDLPPADGPGGLLEVEEGPRDQGRGGVLLLPVQGPRPGHRQVQGPEAQGTARPRRGGGPQRRAAAAGGGDAAVPREEGGGRRRRANPPPAGDAGGGGGGEAVLLRLQAGVGGGDGEPGGEGAQDGGGGGGGGWGGCGGRRLAEPGVPGGHLLPELGRGEDVPGADAEQRRERETRRPELGPARLREGP
ncbi:hypothetical protein EUGRSUZ_G03040 [Eucalyptus grandis]|uniref:Uncharacterized protein n=2 Tax=Eucalyptus grandis TaxID=71139 RepID=A0ACC3K8M6_EUCGR|nr:hypothetical protein EUGRSUZ_G03040 [Eucalyptus grandis]